ncbi:MAG: hypothetical protein WBM39_01045 [Parasphingorhabdus sp.]
MRKDEKREWHNSMSTWQKPSELCDLVDRCLKHFGSTRVFKESGFTFWTDAWIAAHYARLLDAELVKLCLPEPFPDFVLKVGSFERRFEATEVLDPKRRRGDEVVQNAQRIADGGSPVQPDPEENWMTIEQTIFGLKTASEKKAIKSYSQDSGLVIYLNWSDLFCEKDEILSIMQAATEASGKSYVSLDVLWHGQVYRIWENGHAVL